MGGELEFGGLFVGVVGGRVLEYLAIFADYAVPEMWGFGGRESMADGALA
jgi:hypothetical protein